MSKQLNERSECNWSKLPKKKLFLILKLILHLLQFFLFSGCDTQVI